MWSLGTNSFGCPQTHITPAQPWQRHSSGTQPEELTQGDLIHFLPKGGLTPLLTPVSLGTLLGSAQGVMYLPADPGVLVQAFF